MYEKIVSVILTEETVEHLPDDTLQRLAACSTDEVNLCVLRYLENPKANPEIRERVLGAYGEAIETARYLESEETFEQINKINDLDYSQITAGTPQAQLEEWSAIISDVLHNKYAIPYKKPVSGILLTELREEVKALAKESDDPVLKRFSLDLKRFGSFFRDSQHTPYKGTVVKKVIRSREKYEVMERGIQFLLSKKKSGAVPGSWRFL